MENKVRQYIEVNQLIDKQDRIVVGVSGGADSICLLFLLDEYRKKLGFELSVVHINHKLRGKDADEDEAYVKETCHKLGLHFHAYHIDIVKISKEQQMSLEEAGRKARYDAFAEECDKLHCNKVAVAHHMNDTAETMLFHLIRGTGIKGLTGIPSRRRIRDGVELIRPLLCVKREEIESFLKEKGIMYCTDASNLSNDYSRNKIRNQILPFMKEELNEGVIEHMANTAKQLEEANQYLNHMIDHVYQRYVREEGLGEDSMQILLDESVKSEYPVIQKGLVRKIFERLYVDGLKDIDTRHVDQVVELIHMGVGKRMNLPGGLVIIRQYQDVLFTFFHENKNKMYQFPFVLEIDKTVPGEYDLKQIGKTLRVDVLEYKKSMIIPKNAYTKWFDYDKIKNTVFVRTRQTGDYLQIREDGGRKKLKDYFIDQKIPKEERDSRLLLADGNHIMWILSDRISEAYKVDAKTKKILVISLIGGNKHEYRE